MLNFGLKLLHYWRPLRKTSYLKIKGLCGTVIYNLQKRSWKGCKNRATRRQTGEQPNNEPTTGTRATTRPFPTKKKATPFYRCLHILILTLAHFLNCFNKLWQRIFFRSHKDINLSSINMEFPITHEGNFSLCCKFTCYG